MRSHAHDHVNLTELQRQVILGSLLGDMSIIIGRGYRNPKVSASQSTKQTEYLMWKYDMLKNLTAGSKPHTYAQSSDFGLGSDKINYTIRFATMQLPCLFPIYKLVRGDGKKYVSKSWLNEITDPIGLAVWYMDDGCLANRYNVRFALGLVSPEECCTIQDWMLNKWDIVSTIFNQTSPIPKYSHNIYSNLSIGSKQNLRKFRELVEPYIIPSMRYKIDKLDYLS
jgi:hypothetical protein